MSIFAEIGIIIAIAAGVSIVMRFLRQPLLIGYIITGLIVGPYVLGIVASYETIQMLGEVGIALLLFIVGLNLSPRILREVGTISLITGLGQIVFTALLGFGIATLLGFGPVAAWYIAIGLTFSSTIIVLKLLADKDDMEKMYAKISMGLLLFQDIVAMIVLIVASSLSADASTQGVWGAVLLVVKGFVFASIFLLISTRLLPKLGRFFAQSQEMLFMFSIGWGLGVAVLFNWLGLSLEVGSLIAGVTLAASPYHHEIGSRLRPLRDFFIVLFFVFLGTQMTVGNIGSLIIPAIIFTLFVLIGNPLIMMILMGILGYRKRTSFLTGLTVAQISEFSLILAALGFRAGQISSDILSLITTVGIITIAASTYLIMYAEEIYKFFEPALSLFERKQTRPENKRLPKIDVLLFGCNRIGFEFVDMFRSEKIPFIVVDYNPQTIEHLKKEKIQCRYGDAEDIDFIEEIKPQRAKMVVSTIPDAQTNKTLVEKLRSLHFDGVIIVIAHDVDDARFLYVHGASYVIMPHFLGGTYASEMVSKYGFNKESFEKEKEKHLKYLATKKLRGHQHPAPEKTH